MDNELRKKYIIATITALVIAGGACVVKSHFAVSPFQLREVPRVGEEGSAHTHTSFLVIIGEKIVNFCDPKYMLRSRLVHFEDNNCYVIHKHATGITLPSFLKTLGVDLTPACLTLPWGEKYCTEGENSLRLVVNGEEVSISELSYYELRNNDHILLYYGKETGSALLFKYNQIPAIPEDINAPEE